MGEIKSYYKIFPHTVSFLLITVIMLVLFIAGCDNSSSSNHSDKDRLEELSDSVNPGIPDDYSHISHINNFDRWGYHNVHNLTLIKEEGHIAGDWENEDITLLFTDLNDDGIGQWGKQVVG